MHEKLCVYHPLPFAICVALVLALSACGSGSGGPSAAPATVDPVSQRCERQLAAFVGSLDGLRARLIEEIGYRPYVQRIRQVESVYRGTPFGGMDAACLKRAAGPAERTLDEYVRAANVWTRCIAATGCDPESVMPTVARKWWAAGLSLSRLHEVFEASPGPARGMTP